MPKRKLPTVRLEWDREAVQFHPAEIGLTRQSFKDECDITRIVETYARTGIAPLNRHEPHYGDAPDSGLFEAALIQAEIRSQETYSDHFAEPASETSSEPPESTESENPEIPPAEPEIPSESASKDES